MKARLMSAALCMGVVGCAHAWDEQSIHPLEIENSVIISVTAMERAKCSRSSTPVLCDMEFDVVDRMFRVAERALRMGTIAHDGSVEEHRLFELAQNAHEAGIRRLDVISAQYIPKEREVSSRDDQ